MLSINNLNGMTCIIGRRLASVVSSSQATSVAVMDGLSILVCFLSRYDASVQAEPARSKQVFMYNNWHIHDSMDRPLL